MKNLQSSDPGSTMIIKSFSFFFLAAFFLFTKVNGQTNLKVPFGGNAFITQGTARGAHITDKGLTDWSGKETITTVYFGIRQPGQVSVALKLKTQTQPSHINVRIKGVTYPVSLPSGSTDTVHIATLNLEKAGYVSVQLQGVKKSGAVFGVPTDLILTGGPALENLVYVADPKDFHFGRRGPSVHWNFIIPPTLKNKVAYFYNEVYVPKGQDVVGSYFEADGFSFGYFGMQVNSSKERRILFSVWSPFETDHPEEIPDSKKIQLVKKGDNVHGGAFGGEGSGGQSYLKYNWQPDTHYAFLLKSAPDSTTNTTVFTAYFQKAGNKDWQLIASFRRPETLASLDHLYAFLENFSPPMGNITRRGYYTNQWVCGFDGKWSPITQAKFTTDATGNAGQRLDFLGGVDDKGFYLENCGFFDGKGPKIKNTIFDKIEPKGPHPDINFDQLP